MHVDKFNRLIKLLENVDQRKDIHFNFSTFAMRHPCSTVVCAMGIAMLDETFQSQGLHMQYYNLDETHNSSIYDVTTDINLISIATHIIPIYIKNNIIQEIEEFWGISKSAYNYCFMHGHYNELTKEKITPADVINNMREVIRCNGFSPYEFNRVITENIDMELIVVDLSENLANEQVLEPA